MDHFVTSDLHFGHANIITLGKGRPFSSVEEMDEALIENWNSVVKRPDDIVWVLGDFTMDSKWMHGLSFLERMNGRKRLIMGNHDACSTVYRDFHRALPTYMMMGFEVVVPHARVRVNKQNVMLSHYPYIDPPPGITGDNIAPPEHHGPPRYAQFRLRNEGLPLLCGHVHDAWQVDTVGNQVNVGVDVWDYKPVRMLEALSLLEGF